MSKVHEQIDKYVQENKLPNAILVAENYELEVYINKKRI